MLALGKFKVEGKVSLKALLELQSAMEERQKELAKEMYCMRGIFPKPDHYAELRIEMAKVKETLADVRNCFRLYDAFGNIGGNEVVNDCGYLTLEERAYQKAKEDISRMVKAD